MAEPELLELRHKAMVEEWLRRYPPEVSELTFTNLFVWRRSRPVRLFGGGAAVLLLAEAEGGFASLGGPVGEMSLPQALEALRGAGLEAPLLAFERVPESALSGLATSGLEPQEDRDQFDYVYRRADLAELRGRHLHGKRNMAQRCLAAHECSIEPIGAQHLAEVAGMLDRWCAARNCGVDPGLCDEYRAIRQLLEHYEQLDVTGAAVRVDGAVQAFSMGEALSPDTAVIHVEKAMPDIEGLYQVMNQWFCRDQLGGFDYVNREQDLGVPGLRKAKLSYHPHHMVKKFRVPVVASAGAQQPGLARCTE